MRTITINDRVFDELQRRAAETGLTLDRLIEQAVTRISPKRGSTSRRRDEFRLVTFGQGGQFSPHDINKTSALLEIEDIERFGRTKR